VCHCSVWVTVPAQTPTRACNCEPQPASSCVRSVCSSRELETWMQDTSANSSWSCLPTTDDASPPPRSCMFVAQLQPLTCRQQQAGARGWSEFDLTAAADSAERSTSRARSAGAHTRKQGCGVCRLVRGDYASSRPLTTLPQPPGQCRCPGRSAHDCCCNSPWHAPLCSQPSLLHEQDRQFTFFGNGSLHLQPRTRA
jgi:hypothetical protein